MKTPNLSVIVCCYNGKKTIANCLKSLVSQKVDGITYEVILVDDGSKDGTADEIQTFLENYKLSGNVPFYYYRKKNEGLSIARNFGVSKSKADLVAYIDEDAVADEWFVSNLVGIFKENQDVNCIGGKVELLNDQNEIAKLIQNSIFAFFMKYDTSIIGTNMAYRKEFLKKIGGFQSEFIYRGDETALHEKAGDELKALKVNSVIVKHEQPENLKRWFHVRYENGYFRAAIDHLVNKKKMYIHMQNAKALFSLLFPFALFVAHFLGFPKTVILSGVFLYGTFFIMRFIWKGYIPQVINEYRRNVKKVELKNFVLIVYMKIIGRYIADYGYLKGYIAYRKQVWQSDYFQ